MKDYSRQEIRQLLRFWIDGEAELEPERLRYFVARLLEDEPTEASASAGESTTTGASAAGEPSGPRVGLDDLVDQLSNPEILQKVFMRGFKRAWGPSHWSETSHN